MKRLLVASGLILTAALLAALGLFVFTDEAPAPAPTRPKVERTPPPAKPFEPLRRRETLTPRAERHAPPPPAHTGRLTVTVGIPPRERDREGREVPGSARVTVLQPTGVELASLVGDGKSDFEFTGLPRRVPLVLRASATDCLTGLCCDVVLPEAGDLRKTIEFGPAPVVVASVRGGKNGWALRGVRVVVLSGDQVVGEGDTADEGVARISVPVVGRVLVSTPGRPVEKAAVVHLWPGDDVVEVALESAGSAGALEIEALQADGKSARRVTVWIVGESDRPPSAATDALGIATFRGFEANLELTAVARLPDGSSAAAAFVTREGGQRVRLVLAKPAGLVGDVVDPGGRALEGATVEVFMRPWGETVEARSEPSGRFETPPLPCGLARVTATCPGYLPWRSERSVEIRPGVGARVRAVLRPVPTGSIVVTVRDPKGRPIPDASILLAPSRREARTAADGMCRFDDLPVGVVQTVSARRGGLRMRIDDPAAPAARVRADLAAGVDVTLTPSSHPEKRGPLSIHGVLLDANGKPVVLARVEAAGSWCVSGMDGSFRVTGVVAPRADGPVELVVEPGPGLFERVVFPVDFDAEEEIDFGKVVIRARPYARVDVTTSALSWNRSKRKRANWGGRTPSACWTSFSHADELLGVRTAPFEPRLVVSYDGTLLHLPPADDWRDEGRGEIFTATPAARGLLAAAARWTLAPDAAVVVRPELAERPTDVTIAAKSDGDASAELRLEQIEFGALYDPRAVQVPTGNEQPPVDPFAALAEQRVSLVPRFRTKRVVEGLAPGRWRATFGGQTATFVVPGASQVVLER